MCLYPDSGRFVDYANGNFGGDEIGLINYVKNINQWESLKILKDFYGLSGSNDRNREEMQRKIRQQQERERRAAERKAAFRAGFIWLY